MSWTHDICIQMKQKELRQKDIYDDLKLKKYFGLHGLLEK